MTRILILGGGFGGLQAALVFEKRIARDPDVEVTLVNRENFSLFTPMLHEVAASDLDLSNIVNPMHRMLRRVRFVAGDVQEIDIARRRVKILHGFSQHAHELEYDHLVMGLGSVTNFHGIPGLAERAIPMKSLADAIHLRNRLIAHLEEANAECCAHMRRPLLTFVVAGGGFAGVETIAGINDFLREALRHYPNLSEDDLRLVLVHSGPFLLPELGEKLGRYTEEKLRQRGVEVRLGTRVAGVTADAVAIVDRTQESGAGSAGESIVANTLVWTAGTSPHPIVASLPCGKERGRLRTNEFLQVEGSDGIWALGDCAHTLDPTGRPYPPTAQHALRQGKVVAHNIHAATRGGNLRPFRYRSLGQLAAIGRRTGVASILGFRFSGFFAWWLWRTIYLSKLPRTEKKIRVMLDWTLDVLFSKDIVQFETVRSTRAPDVMMNLPDEANARTAGSDARQAGGDEREPAGNEHDADRDRREVAGSENEAGRDQREAVHMEATSADVCLTGERA